MRLSVVVRSKDEAPRLRLTLASLARQTEPVEIVVVNDGSTDNTAAILAEAQSEGLALTSVHHAKPLGRSGAANAGARAAKGEVLLFLDGDTLANPDCAARHLAMHREGGACVGRGETYHLRGTRVFKDPETGEAWPDKAAQVSRLPSAELARLRVTRDQVIANFAGIEGCAEPGIYPGAGPRRLYELEMDALLHHPDCSVLWAAASGSNLSVGRDDFLRAGGFHEALEINEHRELALRLCVAGARMVPVTGAKTYHLTHRSFWRDPLQDTAWEKVFYRAHPVAAVKLLAVFWASLSPDHRIAREARIASLPELEVAARGDTGVDYDAVRRMLPALPDWPALALADAAQVAG